MDMVVPDLATVVKKLSSGLLNHQHSQLNCQIILKEHRILGGFVCTSRQAELYAFSY